MSAALPEEGDPAPLAAPPPARPASPPLAGMTEVSRRRTVGNALANYGRAAVTMLLGLFLQSYLVRSLGAAEYSLWPIVGTCIAAVALIPRGIGAGVGRFLTHALGEGRTDEVTAITSSLFFALLAAAGVSLLAVLGLSLGFERLFDVPTGTAGIGPWAMLLAGLGGVVGIPFAVFQGGLVATQRLVLLNSVTTGIYVLRVVLTVLLFSLLGPSLVLLAAVSLADAFVTAGLLTWLGRRALPWQRISLAAANRQTLRRVVGFSAWLFLSSVSVLLYWQTDNVIINKLLDPTLVAGYSIVATLGLSAASLTTLGCTALAPALTILHAQGDLARIERAVQRTNRAVVPLGAWPLLLGAFYGEELLVLYVGEAFRSFGGLFPIVAGAFLISATQQAPGQIPIAFGKMKLASLGGFTAASTTVLLSVLFAVGLDWGLPGVAAGTLVTWIVYKGIFWNWLVARLLQVDGLTYAWRSTVRPLLSCLPLALVYLAGRLLGLGATLPQLVGITLVAGLAEGLFLVGYGLAPEDRQAVLALLRRWRRGRRA
ncbi:MAG: oligosaccharide flippase family protein [Myxococcota bacterium]|nr:oligosaccharide flippase family protein [Myxococcota bacterium]